MATIKTKVIPAKPEHIRYLAARMRQHDRQEIWAINHHTPEEALKLSLESSDEAYSFMQGKRTLAMFGVGSPSLLSSTGIVWFLSTEETFLKHRRTMAREGRTWLRKFLKDYPMLMNFIDARNMASIRWLKWCGCTFSDPVIYGMDKLPFLKFELKKSGSAEMLRRNKEN